MSATHPAASVASPYLQRSASHFAPQFLFLLVSSSTVRLLPILRHSRCYSGWRAGVEEEVDTATAALRVLDGVAGASHRSLSRPAGVEKTPGGYRDNDVPAKRHAEIIPEKHQTPQLKKKPATGTDDTKKQAGIVDVSENKKPAFPKKREAGPIVSSRDAKTAKVSETKIPPAYTEASAKILPPPPPKKTFPTTIGGAGDKRTTTTTVPPNKPSIADEDKKMEATKRTLHERYQEAEDAKRRRTIQVIDPPPPKTKSQMQGRTARGRASCCAGDRRFSASSIPRRL